MRRFDSSGFSWIELPASLDSLGPLQCFVLEKAKELFLPSALLPSLELVLEELLVNVISYAYPEDRPGKVEVGCGAVDENMFCVQIRDYGRPFDPLGMPDPDLSLDVLERPVGGLGIYFVRKMTELVHYEYVENSNRITCCFSRRA